MKAVVLDKTTVLGAPDKESELVVRNIEKNGVKPLVI